MTLLYNLGSIFFKWEIINVGFLRLSRLTSKPKRFWVSQSSVEALSSLLSSLLLSSSELRSLEEELDKDDEDEDSFENSEEASPIDPSAIVNSFLGTDFERSRVRSQACPESLADLSDGILVPHIVVFWLLEVMIRPVTGHVTASEPHDMADARSSTPPK